MRGSLVEMKLGPRRRKVERMLGWDVSWGYVLMVG